MWFWKYRKGREVNRYSIGEKINFYENILEVSNDKKKKEKVERNLYKLKRYARGKEVFGKVFIVKDKNFYSSAHDGKSRRVVCVGVEDKKMKVIPVRKNNSYVSLSNFDGNRIFNFKRIKKIPIDKVYENRTFKNSNNDFLTKNEKNELRRKLIS